MRARAWACLDACAHILFAMRLIPAALQDRICHRYDAVHEYY